LRNAAFFAGDDLCFAAAGAFGGAAFGAAATGAGAAAAAFAALIAAQHFFVAAIIARLPAALILRFGGILGPTLAGGFETCSTDGRTAFRPGPGGLPLRFGPWRASIAFVNLSGIANVSVTVNGVNTPVIFAGNAGYVGVDQVNVQLPAALGGSGSVAVQITASCAQAQASASPQTRCRSRFSRTDRLAR